MLEIKPLSIGAISMIASSYSNQGVQRGFSRCASFVSSFWINSLLFFASFVSCSSTTGSLDGPPVLESGQ